MLQQQVLKTLEYFDVQDKPLTLLELHKYLLNVDEQSKQASLLDIQQTLQTMTHQVSSGYGFYFLREREKLIKQRLENNFYASERQNRIKKYLPGTRYVPFVRAVAVTGSEALSNSKQGSDVDLFVLVAPKRIWLARLFLTIYLHMRGVRRYGNKIHNRFCLNHYVEEGKIISEDRNIYTAVEYVSLQPAFGSNKIYEFQQKNLEWISKFLVQPQIFPGQQEAIPWIKTFKEKIFSGSFGNWLENVAGKIQRKRIVVRDNILVEQTELSFHPDSKGKQVLAKLK